MPVALGLLRHDQRRRGVIEGAAGVVETRLCSAQGARLTPRIDARIDLVAPVELADRLAQRRQFRQLGAVFLELVHRVGHVAQQIVRQRRQRFGQRARQTVFIGTLRQLRLAQLDQRIHQRRIAHFAKMKQTLVDGAPVSAGRVIQLAMALQRGAQTVLAQDGALRIDQP